MLIVGSWEVLELISFSSDQALDTWVKKKPRPYQKTCLKEATDALNEQKDVIIQLPTGTGKTHSYLGIVSNALNLGLRVCVLCATKDDQGQVERYSKDFKCCAIPSTVYGIEEYNCALTGERADYLICSEQRRKCEESEISCEALVANKRYSEDRFIITNFSKFLSVRPSTEFDLIVIDDSHGFENTVEQHFQNSIRYGKAGNLYDKYQNDLIMENFLGNFIEIFDDIYDTMPPGGLVRRISEDYIKRFAEHVIASDKVELLRNFRTADKFDHPALRDMVYFIDSCVRLTMHTFYIRKDYYAPEDPDGADVIARLSEKFQELIVRQRFGNSRIIFSTGTLGQQPLVHAKSCTFRQYAPNDFVVVPAEEPRIVKDWFSNLCIFEVGDVGSFKDPSTFPKALDLTLELLRRPHVKTLMLFKNYRAQEYARHMIEKEISREIGFIDDTFQSEQVKELVDKSRIILATASSRLWEGIDIQGLLLEIIFDLPYIRPPVHMEGLRSWRYGKRKMLLRLQQGIGRLIRQENDAGVCVIFDNRFIQRKQDSLFSDSLRRQVESITSARLVERVRELLEGYLGEGEEEMAG